MNIEQQNPAIRLFRLVGVIALFILLLLAVAFLMVMDVVVLQGSVKRVELATSTDPHSVEGQTTWDPNMNYSRAGAYKRYSTG